MQYKVHCVEVVVLQDASTARPAGHVTSQPQPAADTATACTGQKAGQPQPAVSSFFIYFTATASVTQCRCLHVCVGEGVGGGGGRGGLHSGSQPQPAGDRRQDSLSQL